MTEQPPPQIPSNGKNPSEQPDPEGKQTANSLDIFADVERVLDRLRQSGESLPAETAIQLANAERDLLATKLDAGRFAWEKAAQFRELLQKWATGMVATGGAVLIAWWGKGIVQDLKPVHPETGTVSTTAPNGQCTGSICDNVVKVSLMPHDAPIDARGDRCHVSRGVQPRNDRPKDVGESYYLSSDFVTD